MVVHVFNPSTWEAKADGSLCVWGLQSQRQGSQGYTVRPWVKQTNKQTKQKQNKAKKNNKRSPWKMCGMIPIL